MKPLHILMLLPLLLAAACGGGTESGDTLPGIHPTDFVHAVTNENRVANATWLDNPLTFGRPELILLVTQNRSPGGVAAEAGRSPVGVMYIPDEGDSAPLGRWMIVNLDLGIEPTMRAGMSFNVSIFATGPDAFVHTVTRRSGATNEITHLSSSGSALRASRDTYVFLTSRLTLPDGTTAATNRHGTATYFTGGNWAIFNLNGAAIPLRATFNVVMVPNTEPGAFPFNTNTARSTVWTGETSLSESAIFHVGQARDTRGTNHRDVALRYSAGRGEWGVVNVDGSDVRQFASFRALVRQP